MSISKLQADYYSISDYAGNRLNAAMALTLNSTLGKSWSGHASVMKSPTGSSVISFEGGMLAHATSGLRKRLLIRGLIMPVTGGAGSSEVHRQRNGSSRRQALKPVLFRMHTPA